ncbi:hypothetical protein A3C89_03950 [Candidatus Kaiserbacteria bacterium RIFCSPHIGHO2_02_FULL_50_50]|uniref:Recombination protein RecR n=1 Tax=Candidatus Kaiserbacteria bacterium RIFCSPHIGHO2_02_FULL_50_50 TaxID=1798492 RepID=A0A1F6DF16_9BACT|nr:MAG: hypothetical protein A3C89_03950 [Candidatus Kaiserbacteria bacterium RIFCSPHIGHO2_02_FULL_50_50]OGG88464.1 MAG: hypothetical protein A3G62_01915 [Candidatus Kaiserbacteria bacterium RIFCSPLOWO2_12_FULL_50_10]
MNIEPFYYMYVNTLQPYAVRAKIARMHTLDELVQHFLRFPGIGPRQARRFAMHLLTEDESTNESLANLIRSLKTTVRPCTACGRYVSYRTREELCSICVDTNREQSTLMVVERDTDVTAIERARTYKGRYFVFGGTVPLLADEGASKKVRASALKQFALDHQAALREIILAFSANPDGDNTARYVESLLQEFVEQNPELTVTHLGRGLSTGSELEYADPDTITFALQNRK